MKGGIKPRKCKAKAKSEPKPRRRISKISKAQAKRNRCYYAKRKEFMRWKPLCQCGGMKDPNTGELICGQDPWHFATDIHHRKGRAGSLLTDTRHWNAVCRTAHVWIGANPEVARAMGLLCQPGEWNTVPRKEAA